MTETLSIGKFDEQTPVDAKGLDAETDMRFERINDLSHRRPLVSLMEAEPDDRHEETGEFAVHVRVHRDRNESGVPFVENTIPFGRGFP